MNSLTLIIVVLALSAELVISHHKCFPKEMVKCLKDTEAYKTLQGIETIEDAFGKLENICDMLEEAKSCLVEFPSECLDELPDEIEQPLMEFIAHENFIEMLENSDYCTDVVDYLGKVRSIYECAESIEGTEQYQNDKKYANYIEKKFAELVPPVCCSLRKLANSNVDESTVECDEFSTQVFQEISRPMERFINRACEPFDPEGDLCQEYFSEME